MTATPRPSPAVAEFHPVELHPIHRIESCHHPCTTFGEQRQIIRAPLGISHRVTASVLPLSTIPFGELPDFFRNHRIRIEIAIFFQKSYEIRIGDNTREHFNVP